MGRASIITVSGFLIVFGLIQLGVQKHQKVLAHWSPDYYYTQKSRNIAASMMDIAVSKFNKHHEWDGALTLPQNPESTFLGGKGEIRMDSTAYFGSRLYLTFKGIVKSSGKKMVTTIHAVANRPGFSIYAYFTDREKLPSGSKIYFTTGDVLNGPVHTNGKFRIKGSPVFNGPISSHQGMHRYYGSPEYNGGKNFNSKEIKLPKNAPDIVKMAKKKNGGIGQFKNDIYVRFKKKGNSKNNDGRVEISKVRKKCNEKTWRGKCTHYDYKPLSKTKKKYNLKDFNDVISSKGNVYVKGTVDGQVTLHSQQNIRIMGDLQYENENVSDNSKPISDDRLGIVSDENTIVDKNAHHDHGYKDVNIDASILTLGESFKVEDYNDGNSRGKIHLLGGLIQKTRGAVGLVSGSGYTKDYTYDSRFKKNSTPGFPKVKRFQIDSWRESTKTVPIN